LVLVPLDIISKDMEKAKTNRAITTRATTRQLTRVGARGMMMRMTMMMTTTRIVFPRQHHQLQGLMLSVTALGFLR